MSFRTRNAYYLRISSNNVLPLYLYLDERHLDWMSDRVLQYVLADLKPLIFNKLHEEAQTGPGSGSANAKKGTVDVKRGDFYQFAYFLRTTEPHSVLIKTRTFTAAPPQTKPPIVSSDTKSRRGKRKPNENDVQTGRKKRKTRGKVTSQIIESDEEEELDLPSEDDDFGNQAQSNTNDGPVRRSRRTNISTAGTYVELDEEEDDDIEMTAPPQAQKSPSTTAAPPELHASDAMLVMENSVSREPSTTVVKEEVREVSATEPLDEPMIPGEVEDIAPPEIELEVDEEEAKPKPLLQLKYQGFNIFGRCLCVVVEPWPPIRAPSRAPSIAPLFSNVPRALSIAPPDFISSDQRASMQRERTPLFLPDPDRGRSETPAPSGSGRILPPVPLFNDAIVMDEDSDEDGLMSFSQSLNYAGDHGAVEVDDEIDGAIFFGDADEAREF